MLDIGLRVSLYNSIIRTIRALLSEAHLVSLVDPSLSLQTSTSASSSSDERPSGLRSLLESLRSCLKAYISRLRYDYSLALLSFSYNTFTLALTLYSGNCITRD